MQAVLSTFPVHKYWQLPENKQRELFFCLLQTLQDYILSTTYELIMEINY